MTKPNATVLSPSNVALPRCAARTGTLLLSLVVTACGDNDAASNQEPVLSFLTYNTALIAQAENLDERLELIIRDLPNTGADVVCLQELWQFEHLERLKTQVKAVYPHAHWSVTATDEAAGCSGSEASGLIGCLNENCADVESNAMLTCAVSNCATEFTKVSPACQKCVLNNQALPPAEIAATCTKLGASGVAYENQNGLLLLSKYQLDSTDYLALDSSFGDRGVLSARIETALLPAVDLFCTHLAATQTGISYPGTYGSWEGERAAQVDSLHGFVDEKHANEGSAVVMGDMNCGPQSGEVAGEDVAGFERLLASKLDAQYLHDESLPCTFCAENTVGDQGKTSVMIDHVLFSDLPSQIEQSMERVLDEPIDLEIDGETVKTYHSDHFGLRVTLSGKPSK